MVSTPLPKLLKPCCRICGLLTSKQIFLIKFNHFLELNRSTRSKLVEILAKQKRLDRLTHESIQTD